MNAACAWCGERLTKQDSQSSSLTHGICSPCAEQLEHPSVPLVELLNEFSQPVFLVGSDTRIQAGNEAACRLVGKSPEQIEGKLGGEVIDCAYARLPGGCGRTAHCDGCVIRNSITKTMRTGKTVTEAAGERPVRSEGNSRNLRFLISTEKRLGGVLLRVEEVTEVPRNE